MTRSVWRLFARRGRARPWLAGLVDQHAAQAVAGAPPWRKPSSIRRHCPAKTLTDSSRLYSPAIARLTLLMMSSRAAVVLELLGAVVDLDPGPCGRCTRSRRSRRRPGTGPSG